MFHVTNKKNLISIAILVTVCHSNLKEGGEKWYIYIYIYALTTFWKYYLNVKSSKGIKQFFKFTKQ